MVADGSHLHALTRHAVHSDSGSDHWDAAPGFAYLYYEGAPSWKWRNIMINGVCRHDSGRTRASLLRVPKMEQGQLRAIQPPWRDNFIRLVHYHTNRYIIELRRRAGLDGERGSRVFGM